MRLGVFGGAFRASKGPAKHAWRLASCCLPGLSSSDPALLPASPPASPPPRPCCSGRRLDALVANAAIYLPTAKEPTFTADGFELSVG